MHIAMFCRSIPDHQLGGMEEITWDLATEFRAKGNLVSLVTTHIPGYPKKFVREGVQVIPLNGTPSGRYSSGWWKKSRFYFLSELNDADIVFGVSAGANSIAGIKNRPPCIFQAHGTSPGEILTKIRSGQLKSILGIPLNVRGLFQDLLYYPKYNAIISVGKKVTRDMKTFPISLSVSPDRLYEVPNGVSRKRFRYCAKARNTIRSQFGWASSDQVIVTVCRLHKEKGLYETLQAFAKWKKKNSQARLLIIGDGPERCYLSDKIRTLELYSSVLMAGRVKRSLLYQYLSAADLFLFLSVREEAGSPLNLLEAIANGLPIVCAQGLMPVGGKGKEVNPRNLTEVVSALDKVAFSERNNCLPDIYSLDGCVDRYLNVFNKIKANK